MVGGVSVNIIAVSVVGILVLISSLISWWWCAFGGGKDAIEIGEDQLLLSSGLEEGTDDSKAIMDDEKQEEVKPSYGSYQSTTWVGTGENIWVADS